jgi:type VI secretion system secreted protein Hcp
MLSTLPRIACAASDVFMCVDGVAGGSADQDFADCSEIVGVSYSVGIDGDAAPPVGGGGSAPHPTCGEYVVSKALDAGSIPLLIRSLLGRRTAEVEFAVRDRGAAPLVYFQLLLSDVIIVEVQQNLESEADAPLESIVMQPAKVEWQFVPQDLNGAPGAPVKGGFDCVRNRRV